MMVLIKILLMDRLLIVYILDRVNIIFIGKYVLYRHIFRTFVEVNNEYNVKFKNDFMATYRFNTKLIKKFVDAQKERIAEVASNIAPTIYDTNKTVEVMDTMQVIYITNTTYNINKLGIKGRDYVGVAMEILDKERYFNEATLHLFNYICRNLAYMSNVIEFTESAITEYYGISTHTFYKALQTLYTANVIKPTTRKSVYIVNHNYIFRGNYTEFIQLYKEMYSDKDVIVNEDGKIVLDY